MLQEEGTACANPLTWEGQGTEEWPLLWQKEVGAKERLLSQESPGLTQLFTGVLPVWGADCGEQKEWGDQGGGCFHSPDDVVGWEWVRTVLGPQY